MSNLQHDADMVDIQLRAMNAQLDQVEALAAEKLRNLQLQIARTQDQLDAIREEQADQDAWNYEADDNSGGWPKWT